MELSYAMFTGIGLLNLNPLTQLGIQHLNIENEL